MMMPVKSQGRLFYFVGASGAGKDSLMHAVCKLAAPDDHLRIASRYITRPAGALDQHVELSSSKFEQQQLAGDFLFDWSAHGFNYAVSNEVRAWVDAGWRVLIDGSRAYLDQARTIYPEIIVVGIKADSGCLQQRLLQRGREDTQAISARLRRNAHFVSRTGRVDFIIENNRGIDEAAKILLSEMHSRF